MRVAVLGLGRMGRAVAERLQEGGHDLIVWNRTSGRADDLVAAGADQRSSPGAAASEVEVVITSLANDDTVRDVATGPEGILATMGSSSIYADVSTISPRLSSELGSRSSRFVAAPILGAPQAVQEGRATFLLGGDAEVIEGLDPLLRSIGGERRQYDRPEKASTAKLAVNLLLLSGIAALAESVAMGRLAGLDDTQLTELLGGSPMLAPGLRNRLAAVVQGAGPTWWTTVLAAKDAQLATETILDGGKQPRLAPVVRDLYEAAAAGGFGDDDITAVSQLYGP